MTLSYILGIWSGPALTGRLAVKSANEQVRGAAVSFSATAVCGNKSLG